MILPAASIEISVVPAPVEPATAHPHVGHVRILVLPHDFFRAIDFDHLAQPGVANQGVPVRQTLCGQRMLQSLLRAVLPHHAMVPVHLDHLVRRTDGVEHVPVGETLHVVAMLVRHAPEDSPAGPGESHHLARRSVVRYQDFALLFRVGQVLVEKREQQLFGALLVFAPESVIGAFHGFESRRNADRL